MKPNYIDGLNVSALFSDGNKPQRLINRAVRSQWAETPIEISQRPIFRFPCGQAQMWANSESIYGRGNVSVNSPLNHIREFIELCKLNNARVCYVINLNDHMQMGVDYRTLTVEAIRHIAEAGLEIVLIEYGNEIYMNSQITGGGLTFKSGLLYNLFVKSKNIQAAIDYCNLARLYRRSIDQLGLKTEYAVCLGQHMNQSFTDWNNTVIANSADICDGYAVHLYPERWSLNVNAIENQLNQHFGRLPKGRKFYFTELALQNFETGMQSIQGYDRAKFWELFFPVCDRLFNNPIYLLWRMGGNNNNSYDYYETT
jgi:hypothetical protein